MSHVLEEGVATDNGLFNGESRFACGWAWCSFTCLATFPRGILWQSSTDTGSRREGKSCPKEAEGRGYGYVGGRRKTVVSVMWRCGASMSRQLPLDNAVSNADIRDERGRGSGGGGPLDWKCASMPFYGLLMESFRFLRRQNAQRPGPGGVSLFPEDLLCERRSCQQGKQKNRPALKKGVTE